MSPAAEAAVARQVEGAAGEPLPVRMLNEYVYCPRLFYLMHVAGEWAPSADTEEGKLAHRRVDRRAGELPAADRRDPDDPRNTARSVTLGSELLGLVARMDVVELAGDEAVPVEYKHGEPPDGPDRAWLPERVQVCAQGLILREHGWRVDHGVIYYPATRQRVEVPLDEALVGLTLRAVEEARAAERAQEMPAPLEDSPKCPRCSLVGICLPDETNLLRRMAPDGEPRAAVRRLVPAAAEALPLHVVDPGAHVGVKSHRLVVHQPDGEDVVVRFKDVSQVNIFGGAHISTPAITRLMGEEIPVGFFSSGGWFYGLCAPLGHSAAELRRRQYARSADPAWCLGFARGLVRSKVRNSRTLLRRNARAAVAPALERLRDVAEQAARATSMPELLGVEGLAAREYFAELPAMLAPARPDGGLAFDFSGRNRRPPLDPVNAMLSLAYSMLTRHFTAACAMVGLDPHLGFYHADRPGRPSLALDLMEPFRPLLADSAVITAVNNGEVAAADFLRVGQACTLTDDGRRRFIACFERRLDTEVQHPVFGYRIAYRRVVEVQARLLARHVAGELESYPAFETR